MTDVVAMPGEKYPRPHIFFLFLSQVNLLVRMVSKT